MRIFADTWLDNHNFMFEKHIYSFQFIQFVKDFLKEIPRPSDYIISETPKENIYK